jgi:beta-N-acetylhexosaminidase
MNQRSHNRLRWQPAVALTLALVWLAGCASNAASGGRLAGIGAPGAELPRPQSQKNLLDAYVARFVNSLSLDDRIGQMIYAQIYNPSCPPDGIPGCIRQFHPGGMIVYQDQLDSFADAVTLTSEVQANSPIPALIGTDNEGGAEDRLVNALNKHHPAALDIGSTNDPAYAYEQGAEMAHDCLSVGLNTNLAPVVDINPYGDSRDFGTTPSQVITMAGAWMQGLQDNGVIATLKHFPGLGGTNLDPHTTLPTIYKSRSEIENFDLAPYRALLSGDDPPGIVMSTDIMVPSIDPSMPAELSYPIITGILRDELHYDGVVLTDALYMDGLSLFFTNNQNPTAARFDYQLLGHIGVLAIKAGDDMLLGTYNEASMQAMVDAIKGALKSGDLTEARIDQSVRRIIRLKIERGLLPFTPMTPPAPQYFSVVTLPVDLRMGL